MKKLTSLLLSAALLVSLAACGGTPSEATASPAPTQEQTAAPAPSSPASAEPTPEAAAPTENGKTLVVYYSATNHTGAVAQAIADTVGGDLFEIVPTTPYTSGDLNWRDENSRVSREHADPALQTIELETSVPENWENYDTVFIGYPIWWGNASWVVTSFVAANDFEGKTVIPFCTSASSGLGESDKNLAAAANGGDWQDGVRFQSSVSVDDVTAWVNGLGL